MKKKKLYTSRADQITVHAEGQKKVVNLTTQLRKLFTDNSGQLKNNLQKKALGRKQSLFNLHLIMSVILIQ